VYSGVLSVRLSESEEDREIARVGPGELRISVNVTANFGNVTDSARLGVARSRL
jgi:hypothetical protein